MAQLKSHLAFGISISILYTGILLNFAIVSWIISPIVFAIVIIASMLPDLDSDTGIPVRVLFKILSIIGAVLSFIYFKNIYDTFELKIIFYVFLTYLFIDYGLSHIFKKLTHHRGMFHSIPAGVIVTLVVLFIARKFSFEGMNLVVIAIASGVGYISHLILDEINSVVNLSGIPFVPNKSLGTALKLFSKSRITNLIIYVILIFLIWFNSNVITNIFS